MFAKFCVSALILVSEISFDSLHGIFVSLKKIMFSLCRPTLPPSKQASGNLLMKAVAAAHHSVKKPTLSFSLKYDPTSPPSPIRSHSYEEKQQQKELLLQQHRELQKQFLQMKQVDESVEDEDNAEEESSREIEESTAVEEEDQDYNEGNEEQVAEEEHKLVETTQEPEASLFLLLTANSVDTQEQVSVLENYRKSLKISPSMYKPLQI